MKWFHVLLSILCVCPLQAIDSLVLQYNDFMGQVVEHHPISVQVSLIDRESDAYEMKARGEFDPKIEVNYDHKSYDDKNYYSRLNGVLKVPVWFGPEFKMGYENTEGVFLNPSENLPPNGLINPGISLPIGRGLMFDQRRKIMEESRIIRQENEIKQIQLLNQVLYEASISYLDWQIGFERLAVQEEAIRTAETLYNNTVAAFQNGDRPAIDTLEALIALKTRQQDMVAFRQEYEKSRFKLNNFLWLDGQIPLELDSMVYPEPSDIQLLLRPITEISVQLDEILMNHPALRKYDLIEKQLILDKRIGNERLKPQLDLRFNPLVQPFPDASTLGYNPGDYKVGFDFSYPLFTRKERANMKLIDIDRQQNSYDASQAEVKLKNLLNTYNMQEGTINDQLNLISENIVNSRRLLQAEYDKFDMGESSIFLINSRESKLFELMIYRLNILGYLMENRFNFMLTSQEWHEFH